MEENRNAYRILEEKLQKK